jgi:hypothetical protein
MKKLLPLLFASLMISASLVPASQAQTSRGASAINSIIENSSKAEKAACWGWGPFCPPGWVRACGPWRCWCRPC